MEPRSVVFVVAISRLLLLGIVSGHHLPNHQSLHMCDANGHSSEEVCQNRPTSSNVLRADQDDQKVRFYLYKNIDNFNEYSELIPGRHDSFLRANSYSSSYSEWKFLIPGFPTNGKSPFPNNVKDAYLERMKNDPTERYNVVVVDWDRSTLCKMKTYVGNGNSTFTEVAGKQIAEMLIFLDETGLLRLSQDVHLIGFSVGVHVADETTRYVKKQYKRTRIIYRLSALDPIGKDFWRRGAVVLRPLNERSFVIYQDTYHTSKRFGTQTKIGDLEFIVNDGHWQPGCKRGIFERTKILYFEDLCDHVYATEVFAKSINNEMKGCMGCRSLETYSILDCDCEDTPMLGEFADRKTVDGYPFSVGRTYIVTGKLDNFGERFEETLVNAGEPQNGHLRWDQLC